MINPNVSPSVEQKFKTLLTPFFKHANESNPSRIVRKWGNPEKKTLNQWVYEFCVRCKTKRNEEDLSKLGVHGYFCDPCFVHVATHVRKYYCSSNSIESLTFRRIWDTYLYGHSRL